MLHNQIDDGFWGLAWNFNHSKLILAVDDGRDYCRILFKIEELRSLSNKIKELIGKDEDLVLNESDMLWTINW